MDGVLLMGAILVLAWLAPRFGVDSRDWPESPEQVLARHGVRWDHKTLV